jgi:hypothetical protein
MYNQLWKNAIAIGGLGAIGAFVLWSLYSQLLSLPVFARMNQSQTFVIFLVFMILVFSALLFMLHAYIRSQTERRSEQHNPAKRINVLQREKEKVLGQLERINHKVETVSLPPPKFKEALSYLNERQRLLLVEKATEYVIRDVGTSANFSPAQIRHFYKEVEQLLELVYHSLRINDRSLLNEPPKCTLAAHLYVKAIDYIDQRIDSSLAMSKDNMGELRSCLRQLKKRLL